MDPRLYFDGAAATPLHPEVEVVMKTEQKSWGNNNSQHTAGFAARKKIEGYLKIIADVLEVSKDQLAITYSGTDSNRRLLWAAAKKFGWKNLHGSAVEHSSIADEILEKNYINPQDPNSLTKTSKLVALMQANSETGVIYKADTWHAKFPETLILRDFSQSFPKGLKPDFKNCDLGTFTPQKMYGPKMIGLTYMKNPQDWLEISKDSHTKSVPLVAGTAKAFELWEEEHPSTEKKLKQWTQQIEDFIATNIPDYKIHEQDQERVPGITNVAFLGIRGSELMTTLSEQENICVSTGSACTSDILTPTRVIQYIEPNPEWQYPIRISLHQFLDDQAVTDFCEILAHYVEELRKRNF
jgi:cysteine desulfurase